MKKKERGYGERRRERRGEGTDVEEEIVVTEEGQGNRRRGRDWKLGLSKEGPCCPKHTQNRSLG